MTTTVQELTQKLQSFPANLVLLLTDEDEQKFTIVDLVEGVNVLNIVISNEVKKEI